MKHCISIVALFITGNAAADELNLDAKTLFERSTTRNVRLSADGQSIELEEGELIEDDGPAAGFSYKPNEEKLSETVWASKELMIENPSSRKATLLVAPGGQFKAIINGKPIDLPAPTKVGGYWQAYSVPPESLRTGRNQIVLHGGGKVWIARAEDYAGGSLERSKHPNRSSRSTDAGKQWLTDKLGPSGDIEGEYCIRLRLERFVPHGSVTLPVMDAQRDCGPYIAGPSHPIPPVQASFNATVTPTAPCVVYYRSGTTPVPNNKDWLAWQTAKPQERVFVNPKGRYYQLAFQLGSTNLMTTSAIRGVRIETNNRPLPKKILWSDALQISKPENDSIVRTSAPFTYEPFNHSTLKKLRTDHKLDDVTKDAKTELQLIEKLAVWTAATLQGGHLKDIYPAWDALEILKPHADGRPIGGFCQQYNLVFLQACESFGIPGRAVSIGHGDHFTAIKGSGHEVVELWSNDFKKWIYVDGNLAWYAIDAKTKTPLSLLELRERQQKAVKKEDGPTTEIVELAPGKQRWTSLTEWPVFQELRMIPRSNFLEQKTPLPLNQGMRGWFWTGHHVWSDKESPASIIYGNRVTDRKNWEWTLNQAHFTLEATPTEGELKVHLDTETPGFDTFLASIDGETATKVESGFAWKLKKGKNRLEVWPRNIAGREGIKSHVVVEMP